MDAIEAFIWENRRLFRAASAAADRALKPLRIDAASRALLEFLAREPAPISLSELARKRSVSRQHIHQSLRRLRDPRWVMRSPDARDARSLLVSLSPAGREVWQQVRSIDRAILRKLARSVDAGAVARATTTAKRLRELLEQLA